MKWDNNSEMLTEALANVFKVDSTSLPAEEYRALAAQLFEVDRCPHYWAAVTPEQIERIEQYAGPHGYTIWKLRLARKSSVKC